MKVQVPVVACLILLPAIATAGAEGFGVNQIGLFMIEPDEDSAHTYRDDPLGTQELIIILLNPHNEVTDTPVSTVGGFEFGVSAYGFVYPLDIELPDGLVNELDFPEVRVTGPLPVIDGQCLLGTVRVRNYYDEWNGSTVTLSAVSEAWIPGMIGALDAEDESHPIAISPWTGVDCPLFFFWRNPAMVGVDGWYVADDGCVWWGVIFPGDDIVPGESVSFGTLKALYR